MNHKWIADKAPCSADHSSWEIVDSYHTLTGDWNLYCDNEWKAGMLDSLFFLGFAFGASGFGSLADRIGRRRAWACSGVLLSFSVMACAASPDYFTYCFFRVLTGVGIGGFGVVTYVLAQEIIGGTWGGITGIGQAGLFSFANILLAPTAWAVPGWRAFTVVTGITPLVFLAFYKMIPESPRWLLSKGETAKANEVMVRIAEGNGVDIPAGIHLTDAASSTPDNEEPTWGRHF